MSVATVAELPTGLLIGGRWTAGGEGTTFPVTDPATGELIAEAADGGLEDARAAGDAAAGAATGWAALAPRTRSEILRAAFELMRARREEIAEVIVRENGKPHGDALGEIDYAAEFLRWYAEKAVRNLGTVGLAPGGANRLMVVHQPVGICVLVTPWNFPAAMATRKIAPALAAGCTVVLKPARDTPLTALLIAALLEEAGLPPGVINVLPSRRAGAVVAEMLSDARVRKLSFTGSTEVGRKLLAVAAGGVVNCSMELGRNAPFLVFADADLDAAVVGALVAKMCNVGEACKAANRFYVEATIAEAFTARLAEAMQATPVGPLINDEACAKNDALIADAVAKGARVVCGGEQSPARARSSPRPCSTTCQPTPRSCARRSSVPSLLSSPSTARPKRCAR